ncbi:MAG: M13-type metalloendopeptidase [Flavobacteriales bacterium AspAUS03]
MDESSTGQYQLFSLNNEIVFQAAIFQSLFYDFQRNVAMNFDGIDCVIGYEISRGFDNCGSQFDDDDNFRNRW